MHVNAAIGISGHGKQQTYWLVRGKHRQSSGAGSDHDFSHSTTEFGEVLHDIDDETSKTQQMERLVKWNVSVLHELLKEVVARRMASGTSLVSVPTYHRGASRDSLDVSTTIKSGDGGMSRDPPPPEQSRMPIEDVAEVITLPEFNQWAARRQQLAEDIVIVSLESVMF